MPACAPAACPGSGRAHSSRPAQNRRRVIERLDDRAPSRPLAVVDLAKIEHLPLHHPAAGATLALDNVPIEMLFAVFAPPVRLQVHAADSTPTAAASQGLGLDYSRF